MFLHDKLQCAPAEQVTATMVQLSLRVNSRTAYKTIPQAEHKVESVLCSALGGDA